MRHYTVRGYQEGVELTMFGIQPRIEAYTHTDLRALLGPHQSALPRTTRLVFLSRPTETGFGHVTQTQAGQIWLADGALLKAGEAAVGQTRDCPLVVITNTKHQEVFLLHTGRPQLSFPPKENPGTENCLQFHLSRLRDERWGDAYANSTVLVAGCICAKHFRHDHHEARHLLEPFLKTGAIQNPDLGTLDLRKVIVDHLVASGLRRHNIECDTNCTWSTEELSSKRAHEAGVPRKSGANTCVVVNTF